MTRGTFGRLAEHLRDQPLAPPESWPEALRSDEDLGWLRVAVEMARDAGVEGKSGKISTADFDRALLTVAGEPSAILEAAEELSQPHLAALKPIQVVLFTLLSRAEAPTDDAYDAIQQASITLAKAALGASGPGRGAAIALRLARLYDEVGEDEEAEGAWVEAIRRHPLIAWVVPPEDREGVDADPEQVVLGESEGEAQTLRQAIVDLRAAATKPRALEALDGLTTSALFGREASLLRAIEHMRVGAARAPSAPELEGDMAAARALFTNLTGWGPLVPLMETMARIIEGDEAGASEQALALVMGVPDEAERQKATGAIVAALTTKLRQPPYAIDELLRVSFFEAMMDLTSVLEEPRSAFAKLRTFFAGLALAAAIGAAAPSLAQASEHEETLAPEDTSAQVVFDEEDEATDGELGGGGGGDMGENIDPGLDDLDEDINDLQQDLDDLQEDIEELESNLASPDDSGGDDGDAENDLDQARGADESPDESPDSSSSSDSGSENELDDNKGDSPWY